jgi:hypothetical protein
VIPAASTAYPTPPPGLGSKRGPSDAEGSRCNHRSGLRRGSGGCGSGEYVELREDFVVGLPGQRHRYRTLGAHPLTIKERLGHASIKVTMDTYGHLFPSQDEALAAALNGALRESLVARQWHDGGSVSRLRRSEG